MYLENLDEWILEENKVVTYKYLSRSLNVHVNTAKQMLWNFVQTKGESCKGIVYLVSGQVKASDGDMSRTKVCLVKKEDLEKTSGEMEKVFSQHIYSIQLNETITASALYATDLEVFKEDPFTSCNLSAIKNPAAVLRAAVAPPKIAPGVQLEKKVEIKKKIGGIENAFAKSTKKSSEDSTITKESSTPSVKEEKVPSPEKKTTEKKNSVNSGSKKGGIASFFANQAAKPKVEKIVKPEKPIEDMEVKSEEKENVVNHQKKEVKSTNKSTTKSFGKRDQEDKNVLDDVKKRKRIQVMSDSEEEAEKSDEEKEERMETEAAPPQAKLLDSDSEDEVIPATPKENPKSSRAGRRRVKRTVDKTYVDEDGYMVTKKVVESASETDDEPDVKEEKPEVKPEKLEVKKLETKNKDESTEPKSKKAKVVAPATKPQKGIMNFFSVKPKPAT